MPRMIFQEKKFFIFYYINWSSLNVSLFLLLEILGNMCIAIACYQFCDLIDFEIYLSVLVKPFSYMTETLAQKLKYLKNEKSF